METYSKYDVFRTQYQHLQHHKPFYSHHHNTIPGPSSRQMRKSIIPYTNYMSPSTPIYYPPPPLPIPPPAEEPRRQPTAMMIRGVHSTSRMIHPILTASMKKQQSDHHMSPKRKFTFTSKDIDAVLYGYLGDENDKRSSLHSLSGVRIRSAEIDHADDYPDRQTAREVSYPGLPLSLSIKEIRLGSISHAGVFAKDSLSRGTRFGPFKGDIIKPCDLDTINSQHCWEIFDNDGCVAKYVVATSYYDNWMKFVNCARYGKEQNIVVLQEGREIYYEVTEDIDIDQELLAWYGSSFQKYMEIPIVMKTNTAAVIETVEKKFTSGLADSEPAGSYPCNRCGKIFSYAYYREKHLKYTRCVDKGDRKFPCHLCQRSFEKKDRLRIHILHVHQKYRPHVCKTCGKRFSQSSSLNKHSRVHTGERPYACPHCPKSFTASSILRTHLRQHNGERPFKCKFCGKAFASHAAHDSHVKRTHEKLKTFLCHVCSKTFSMEFELNFHLSTHSMLELENSKKAEAAKMLSDVEGMRRAFSEENDSSLVIDMKEGNRRIAL